MVHKQNNKKFDKFTIVKDGDRWFVGELKSARKNDYIPVSVHHNLRDARDSLDLMRKKFNMPPKVWVSVR